MKISVSNFSLLVVLASFLASTAKALSTSLSSSTSCKMGSGLDSSTLRSLVKEAARRDSMDTVDLNGISWMEHINLVVGSKSQAEFFYQEVLGFTRDLDAKFHVNLGQQQFHLAENGDPAQKVTGSIGLVVPNLDTVRKNIENAGENLKGTKFQVLNDVDDAGDCMTISCPWGNRLHLYCASRDDAALNPTSISPQKMVKLHADGGSYSANRMAIRGKPGIRYIEIACRTGSTSGIAKFYEEMIGCNVVSLENETNGQGTAIAVSVGPGVHLIFIESDTVTEDDFTAMEGVHLCIYAHNFKSLYEKLQARELIWTNPRFTHLDSCDTWEEAAASKTLRFKHIIDLDSGEKLLELEHETRPLRHGQYMKAPHYIPK